jgi:hypothetical protein
MFDDLNVDARGCLKFVAYLIAAFVLVLFIFYLLFTLGWFRGFGGGDDDGKGPGGGNAPGPGTGTYRGGPGTANEVPVISARDYSGGSAPVTVTGSFSFDSTVALDTPATFSDGTQTSLSYAYNLESGGILLAFSDLDGAEGLGLNVAVGPWIATYMGQGCSWEIEVTAVRVSGNISCTDIPATNQDDGTTGTIDVELDFSADSPEKEVQPTPG